MHDMALRQLEEANKELIEMNDTKKEILYMIGLLYEKQGKKGNPLLHSSRFTTPSTATAT
ncbi:MAG: hypothetical protein ACLT38_00130 [Akkermansia sp.]